MTDEITPDHVARRWRLRGAEGHALLCDAKTRGLTVEKAKLYLAHLGLVLAWVDADDWPDLAPAEFTRCLTARAIRHARKALADSAPATHDPANDVSDSTAARTLCELAEEPFAPGFEHEITALLTVASAPQEHWLLRAFLEEGCASLAEVDRFYNWTHGQANAIAKRLRRKAQSAA
jgi:hypothetical protein